MMSKNVKNSHSKISIDNEIIFEKLFLNSLCFITFFYIMVNLLIHNIYMDVWPLITTS